MSYTYAHEKIQTIHDDAAKFDADENPGLFPYGIATFRLDLHKLHQGVRDGDWKKATDAAANMIGQAKNWEAYAIASMRVAGLSWDQIGETLGITRQAAWERWRFLDTDGRPRPSED